MIEEQAIVTDCDKDFVWVQTQRKSSCGQCSVKEGCGTQVLSKVFGNKSSHVRCLYPHNVSSQNIKIGDRVIIGLEESALLSGSFLVYFLPLLMMIFCAGLMVFFSKLWWPEWVDLLTVAASFSGLIFGLLFSHRYTHQYVKNENRQNRYEPVIIKKLPHP